MPIAGVGYVFFATTMIVIGILGLIKGDFVAIWQSVPKGVPAGVGLAYLCAVVSLASGSGLLFQRAATPAARLLLAYLLLWLLLIKAPVILHAPAVEVSWEDCAETAVIVAAAWVLYAWFAADWDRQRFGFATGEKGMRIARALYGLALIPFGLRISRISATPPHWCPDGCQRTWPGLVSPAVLISWQDSPSSSACMPPLQPRSRRCRWPYSPCWCGARSWPLAPRTPSN